MKIQNAGLLVALLLSPAFVLAEPPAPTGTPDLPTLYEQARTAWLTDRSNRELEDAFLEIRCRRLLDDVPKFPAWTHAMLEQLVPEGAEGYPRATACRTKALPQAAAAMDALAPAKVKPGVGRCEPQKPRKGAPTTVYELETVGQMQMPVERVVRPESGELIECSENGNWSAYVNIKDGKRHGWMIAFHDNGKKQHETFFVQGQLAGVERAWYDTGTPNLIETFGRRDWTSSTSMLQVGGVGPSHYITSDRHGWYRNYWKTGVPRISVIFERGKACGDVVCRAEDGSPSRCPFEAQDDDATARCRDHSSGMSCPPCTFDY